MKTKSNSSIHHAITSSRLEHPYIINYLKNNSFFVYNRTTATILNNIKQSL